MGIQQKNVDDDAVYTRSTALLNLDPVALEPGRRVITGSITASAPIAPLGVVEARSERSERSA